MTLGVILYGPPAAGKDTITALLGAPYELFRRVKHGPGKSRGYRMRSAVQVDDMHARGEVIYANQRYNATYVIDRPGIEAALSEAVPVVHLGQVAGIEALVRADVADWLLVQLWCERDATRDRSRARGDEDVSARLSAWDATATDLAAAEFTWNLIIDTSRHEPADAAAMIRAATPQGPT